MRELSYRQALNNTVMELKGASLTITVGLRLNPGFLCPALDGGLKAPGLGETSQCEFERALKFVRLIVYEVSEGTSFGSLLDPGSIVRAEDRNHGTVGFFDDL